MIRGVTPQDYARARRLLLRRDPVLAALIRKHGPCGLAAAQRADHFSALVRAIVGQQLSTKAATTIHRRLIELLRDGTATPEGIAALGDAQLRSVGLSRQKSAYLRDLCARVAGGEVHLDALGRMTDDEVIAELTKIKGVGRWTAEMFLMFNLRRPDVWPVGDLGVRSGLGRVLGWDSSPTPRETELVGVGYRPWRSAVAWYCWRAVETLLPVG